MWPTFRWPNLQIGLSTRTEAEKKTSEQFTMAMCHVEKYTSNSTYLSGECFFVCFLAFVEENEENVQCSHGSESSLG